MILTTVNCFLAVVFLFREYLQYHALKTKKLTENYTGDFWNFIDCLASVSVLTVTISYFFYGPGWLYDYAASISGVLMWLKFLGLIKAISPEIATFVLMLTTIFLDMRSFMFVLACVILGFAHAIYMVLAGNGVDWQGCDHDDEVVCALGEYELMENQR